VTATLHLQDQDASSALLQLVQSRTSRQVPEEIQSSSNGSRAILASPTASLTAAVSSGLTTHEALPVALEHSLPGVVLGGAGKDHLESRTSVHSQSSSWAEILWRNYGILRASWTIFGGCLVAIFVCSFAVLRGVRLGSKERSFFHPSSPVPNHRLPAWVSKADSIFVACDRNKDGRLNFEEFSWLAQRNGRHLSQQSYSDLCRSLGANSQKGLTVQEFRQSYALLGHDVDYDFAVVQRALKDGSCPGDAAAALDASSAKVAQHAVCRLSLSSPGFAARLTGNGAGKTGHMSSMLRALSAWIALR